jgi:hypothetical protein
MKVLRGASFLAMALILSGVLARADSFTASLYSPTATVDTIPVVLNGIGGAGYTVSFSANGNPGVVRGAVGGAYAIPVAGVSGGQAEYYTGDFGSPLTTDPDPADPGSAGNYFSTGTGSITISFGSQQSSLGLLWGSVDNYNTLSFDNGYVITGTAVQNAISNNFVNGYQGFGGSAYVLVDTSFTTVTFSSTQPSFEFAGVAAGVAPIPEPASLLLFGSGIFGLVGVARRKFLA